MKYLILTLLLSFSFSECDDLSLLQCSSNTDCEWVEDIEYGSCSEFNQNHTACEETIGCWGAYQYPGWYSGWYCAGGNYQVDDSYCQNNPNPPSCDEMTEFQCVSDQGCDWTTTYQWYNCNNFNGSSTCNQYSEYGCYWYSHWYYSGWSSCNGPSFQIENGGYCEENDYIQGDLNGDLILNILDIIIIVDIILNQESNDLADVNSDGIVNIIDIVQLVDIIIQN